MKQLFFQTLLGTTVTGAIILTANIAKADLSPKEVETRAKNNLVALEFKLPSEAILGKNATPEKSVRGGVRNHCSGSNPRRCRTPDESESESESE